MEKEVDFARWLNRVQRIKNSSDMELEELEEMYEYYQDYINEGKHKPYYL